MAGEDDGAAGRGACARRGRSPGPRSAHLDGTRALTGGAPPSAVEEVQLEQHRIRIEDENLPQSDRGDLVEAMLQAAALKPRQHLPVVRASERHVMQRSGRPRSY